jgi:bifunctional DNA-binding transcriptional regulator/antitoxin component of YhaV-PrlF toxin-antitoxin module
MVQSERSQNVSSTKVRVRRGGQLTIPIALRETLAIKEGDVLFARAGEGELHLFTAAAAMRRAQAMVRHFVPEGVSLVDELIADRRREAAKERD